MSRLIKYKPAEIDIHPDYDKYYGVFGGGHESGNLRDRAILVGLGGYPKPKSWIVVNLHKCSTGNTWERFDDLRDKSMNLREAITHVMSKGFIVREFDNHEEFFRWCSESRS